LPHVIAHAGEADGNHLAMQHLDGIQQGVTQVRRMSAAATSRP
jgi:hypothetical protein